VTPLLALETPLVIAAAVGGLVLLWAVVTFNGFVRQQAKVREAFSGVDVQLKRRHDLIPNLVAAVKGEMQFEQDTLEKVIQARQSAISAKGVAEAADKENALTQTLGRLFALAENYPNLKANETVKPLMEELSSTENRIGFARQFYNDIATRFNTAQQVFPDSFIAQAFKFQPVELFEIRDEAERAVPKVDLNIRSDKTRS
jgi:LemA protein